MSSSCAGLVIGYGLPANGHLPAALLARSEAGRVDSAEPPRAGIGRALPPCSPITFAQYCATVENGDIGAFLEAEALCAAWWTPLLDRGAGALLHIAADHGQLEMAKLLVERKGARVNQQDRALGWTPLHRCARLAHCRARPYLELFDYLLSVGADVDILTYEGYDDGRAGCIGWPQSCFDLCADVGLGWRPGRLRRVLRALAEAHAGVPKPPAFRYEGPLMGEEGMAVMATWVESGRD